MVIFQETGNQSDFFTLKLMGISFRFRDFFFTLRTFLIEQNYVRKSRDGRLMQIFLALFWFVIT